MLCMVLMAQCEDLEVVDTSWLWQSVQPEWWAIGQ